MPNAHYTPEIQPAAKSSVADHGRVRCRNDSSAQLPEGAEVIVLGDTAYESEVVRKACEEKGYIWIFPAIRKEFMKAPRATAPNCGLV